MSTGGPTTRRSNFRQCTSNFRKSSILQYPSAKQTTDVSKNFRRDAIQTILSQKFHLWTWNAQAQAALRNRWSISPYRLLAFSLDNMQTNRTTTGPILQSPKERDRQCPRWSRMKSKPLLLQRRVWHRPSRVKSPIRQAYSHLVREILLPALMQNSRLTSECQLICPFWVEYSTCNNQIKWADTPCNRKSTIKHPSPVINILRYQYFSQHEELWWTFNNTECREIK